VTAFIDGFNLYHAVKDLGQNHLKWLNLRAVCEEFAPSPSCALTQVLYFSAFARWKLGSWKRHRALVAALESVGVKPIMGQFKEKDRKCYSCGREWLDHEEKETDVSIGIHLLQEAHNDTYDRALMVTADSDLSPALRMLRREFPDKEVRIVTPVGRRHSGELAAAIGGFRCCRKMKLLHVERNLFPAEVRDASGQIVARRPPEYDPPL